MVVVVVVMLMVVVIVVTVGGSHRSHCRRHRRNGVSIMVMLKYLWSFL